MLEEYPKHIICAKIKMAVHVYKHTIAKKSDENYKLKEGRQQFKVKFLTVGKLKDIKLKII